MVRICLIAHYRREPVEGAHLDSLYKYDLRLYDSTDSGVLHCYSDAYCSNLALQRVSLGPESTSLKVWPSYRLLHLDSFSARRWHG